MAYQGDDTFENISRQLAGSARSVVQALILGEELYQDIQDGFVASGNTNTAYARVLYQLPDTGKVRLAVDATAKTITAVDSSGTKLNGANTFAAFQVGQDVKTTLFANAGNNITSTIITGKPDSETITIGEAATLVNETGSGDERVQQQPNSIQIDAVAALMNTVAAIHELYGALTNVATTTSDRIALLRDFT